MEATTGDWILSPIVGFLLRFVSFSMKEMTLKNNAFNLRVFSFPSNIETICSQFEGKDNWET